LEGTLITSCLRSHHCSGTQDSLGVSKGLCCCCSPSSALCWL